MAISYIGRFFAHKLVIYYLVREAVVTQQDKLGIEYDIDSAVSPNQYQHRSKNQSVVVTPERRL